uniref:Uncharacterized protein n=1 Tax=viral metagenome TaxID=1070528 RepID=A0A6M3JNE4_9ZZZZ
MDAREALAELEVHHQEDSAAITALRQLIREADSGQAEYAIGAKTRRVANIKAAMARHGMDTAAFTGTVSALPVKE